MTKSVVGFLSKNTYFSAWTTRMEQAQTSAVRHGEMFISRARCDDHPLQQMSEY